MHYSKSSFDDVVDLSENIISYPCIFDNNVNLKIIKYAGNNEEIIKMYNFYNGGSLLLREPKKKANNIKFNQ